MPPLWAPLLSAVALSFVRAASADGHADCPCVNRVNELAPYRLGSYVMYTPEGTDTQYQYPLTYGQGCSAHDSGLPPRCDATTGTPSWCRSEWCYIDPNNCDNRIHRTATQYFPRSNLVFSYATCRGAESQRESQRLIDTVQDYSASAQRELESVYVGLNEGEGCRNEGMCPCSSKHGRCWEAPGWGNNVSFEDIGAKYRQNITEEQRNISSCLATEIGETYLRVGSEVSDSDFQKVGYQYFGEHAAGSYAQWPNMDFCTPDYDPRLRPWYAAGATGPKDVVIVVDVSGSMSTQDRIELAKQATLAILDTLTWKDHSTIILFNNIIKAEYSAQMVPVTEEERGLMKAWVEDNVRAGGGTNFHLSKFRAFDIIHDSVYAGKTSMCQKALMFLTDGTPSDPFEEEDFERFKTLAERYNVIPFTYSLGDDADTAITRRIACENKGIFYKVRDNADLKSIMSRYYGYFAAGQEICQASYVRYVALGTGGQSLHAGCLPTYDRTSNWAKLLGVTCTDANLITLMADFRQQSAFDSFICQASDMTKMCQPLYLHPCHLQLIRREYSEESVCRDDAYTPAEDLDYSDANDEANCPCASTSCSDESATWTDELDYYCDSWVGDDCSRAGEEWGYSEAGVQELMVKCKRSCGLCEWRDPCPYESSRECNAVDMPTQCRKCSGRVSGVDIEGTDLDDKSLLCDACPVDSYGWWACRNLTDAPTSASFGVSALAGPAAVLIALAAARSSAQP